METINENLEQPNTNNNNIFNLIPNIEKSSVYWIIKFGEKIIEFECVLN